MTKSTKRDWRKLPPWIEEKKDKLVFFDIETDAAIDLTAVGSGRYFSDPATRVTLNCWKRFGDEEVSADVDPESKKMLAEMKDDDILVAHNAIFDLSGVKIPPTFPGKMICSMAMCRSVNIPASLEDSCALVNSEHFKAETPKTLKESIKRDYAGEALFDATDKEWQEFLDYGKKDVLALEELFCRLCWRINEEEFDAIDTHLRINMRGMPFDRARLKEEGDRHREEQINHFIEFRNLVGFEPTQTARLMEWLASQNNMDLDKEFALLAGIEEDGKKAAKKSGVKIKSVAKKEIDLLYDKVDDLSKQVLDLRKKAGKQTATKLVKIRTRVDKGDGPIARLRDCFMFAGAITGRWKSVGANMQNNERGGIIKNLVVAPKGMKLYVGDFSQIELRIAFWVSKEDEALRVLHTEKDFYKETASVVYGVPVDKITPQQRFFGKSLVLGATYGMGYKKFAVFCRSNGSDVTEEEAEDLINKYRQRRAGLYAAGGYLGQALKDALRAPGDPVVPRGTRGLTFCYNKRAKELMLRLPTKRLIRYGDIKIDTDKHGRQEVSYHDPSEGGRRKYFSHGGLILENICQAISRDLLCRALVRFERELDGAQDGEGVIAHVHDEVIAQVKKSRKIEALDDLLIPPEFRTGDGKGGLLLDCDSHLVDCWGAAK